MILVQSTAANPCDLRTAVFIPGSICSIYRRSPICLYRHVPDTFGIALSVKCKRTLNLVLYHAFLEEKVFCKAHT